MSEDMKTLWCGNLSDKVTEEILYELFLQAGPVQNVTIPKDRNGKQRPFGFVTYKHVNSVLYALELFNGTSLFNRILNISHRKNVELPQINYSPDNFMNFNNWLQLGQEMILGNDMSHLKEDLFGTNMILNSDLQMKETNNCSHKNDRRSQRTHPYHRDQHKHSSHHMDHSSSRNRNSHNSNHYSKHNYKNSRYTY